MHQPIKIGFVLLSNASNPIPSTRIVILNMLPYLNAAGFEPHIVFEPFSGSMTPDLTGVAERVKNLGIEIVFFQKVFGESVLSLAYELRSLGIKTVFSICDLVLPEICAATDATIVVTEYLKSLYPKELQHKISVVHDGIERPDISKKYLANNRTPQTQPLKSVLVTSFALDKLPLLENPPDWLKVTIVGRYPETDDRQERWRSIRWNFAHQNNWQERWKYLKFLTNSRIRCQAWGPTTVYEHITAADIGIIPIEPDPIRDVVGAWKVKSENRLTLLMAAGLPVVATPIPSYEAVIEQGVNGYLANDLGQWHKYLNKLRDPDHRKQIGVNARRTALERYSMDLQAERLINVLRSVRH